MKHNDKLRKEYEDLTDSSAYSNKEKQELHYGYTLWLEDKIGQSEQLKTFNCINLVDGFEPCKEQCLYCRDVKGF